MTKQVLEQYVDLLQEIKKLNKRIEKLEKQSVIVSDVVQNGYKRHAVIKGIDIYRSKKLNELKRILEERKTTAIEQEIQIEKFIKDIHNSKTRQIFEHKYIDGMSWVQIQLAMGYKHEDGPRKTHDRYLAKLNRKIKKN